MSFSTIAYNIENKYGKGPALFLYNTETFGIEEAQDAAYVTMMNYFSAPGSYVEPGDRHFERLGWAEQLNTILPFLGSVQIISIVIRFHKLEMRGEDEIEVPYHSINGPMAKHGSCGGTVYVHAMEGEKVRVMGWAIGASLKRNGNKPSGYFLEDEHFRPEGYRFAQVIAQRF